MQIFRILALFALGVALAQADSGHHPGLLGQDYALAGEAPRRHWDLAADQAAAVAASPPATTIGNLSTGWIGVIDPTAHGPVAALPAHAVLDPEPARNRVEHGFDGHQYLDLGTPRFMGLGTTRGTVVGEDGQLRLAPGRTKGAWISPVHQEPRSFNYLQTGIRGSTPAGSRAKVYVRAYAPDGQRSRWMRVRREHQYILPILADFLQILIIMLAGMNGQTPVFGGVTVGTSVLGQGQAPPIFTSGSFPPGMGPGTMGPQTIPGSQRPGATSPTPATPSIPSMPQGQGQPMIIPRADWGAAGAAGSIGGHRPSSITIHHSEGPNSSYAGADTVKGIQSFHQGTRGWSDIGYHYLIGPDGKIFEGRQLELVGSHSPPNEGRVGICMMGDFQRRDDLTQEALGALLDLMAWLCRGLGIDPGAQVAGHRDQRSTDCPGTRLYAQIPAIQQETRRRLGF